MKILHTADWHVGKPLRGRGRLQEQSEVLAEVVQVARDEEVDLVLISGDLFDSPAPSAEAEEVVYRILLDLSETGAVLVVAGNHDNERRLKAIEPLLRLGKVEARPFVRPPAEGGVWRGRARGGEEYAVAFLPWVPRRYIVRATELMSLRPDEQAAEFKKQMAEIVQALAAPLGDETVNILLGHVLVGRPALGGGERPSQTEFDYALDPSDFPPHLQYVALGHIHKAQAVVAPCPVWYSGAPLCLDFGEERAVPANKASEPPPRVVLVVEVEPGKPARVREVPIRSGRRLLSIRGNLEELRACRDRIPEAYLRVELEEEKRPGVADEVRKLFPDPEREGGSLVMDVRLVSGPDGAREELPTRRGRAPKELFIAYLTERRALDERLVNLFEKLYEEEVSQAGGSP